MLKSGNKTSVEAEQHRATVRAKVAENASFDQAYLVITSWRRLSPPTACWQPLPGTRWGCPVGRRSC